jgi:hypothetical protein
VTRSWTAAQLLAETRGEVWHWAPEAAVPLIRRHGLLSAAALVALFAVPEPRAARLLTENRRGFEVLCHPDHGRAELRRQQMPEGKLATALSAAGTTPAAWRRHINAHVFFWIDRHRAEKLRAADPQRAQVLLAVDLAALLAAHGAAARLTPINTGAVRLPSHRRSLADWHPLGAYADPRRPVELAVPWAVPGARAGGAVPWREARHAPPVLTPP